MEQELDKLLKKDKITATDIHELIIKQQGLKDTDTNQKFYKSFINHLQQDDFELEVLQYKAKTLYKANNKELEQRMNIQNQVYNFSHSDEEEFIAIPPKYLRNIDNSLQLVMEEKLAELIKVRELANSLEENIKNAVRYYIEKNSVQLLLQKVEKEYKLIQQRVKLLEEAKIATQEKIQSFKKCSYELKFLEQQTEIKQQKRYNYALIDMVKLNRVTKRMYRTFLDWDITQGIENSGKTLTRARELANCPRLKDAAAKKKAQQYLKQAKTEYKKWLQKATLLERKSAANRKKIQLFWQKSLGTC